MQKIMMLKVIQSVSSIYSMHATVYNALLIKIKPSVFFLRQAHFSY